MTMLAVPLPPSHEHLVAESGDQALIVDTDASTTAAAEVPVYRPSWRALVYGAGFSLWLVGLALAWFAPDVSLGMQMAAAFWAPGLVGIDLVTRRLPTDLVVESTPTHVPCVDCLDMLPRHLAIYDDGYRCPDCDDRYRAEGGAIEVL